MVLRVPIERLDQSGDRIRRILDFRHLARSLGPGHVRGLGRRSHHDAQQIARCLRLGKRPVAECHAKVALDPNQQLHA